MAVDGARSGAGCARGVGRHRVPGQGEGNAVASAGGGAQGAARGGAPCGFSGWWRGAVPPCWRAGRFCREWQAAARDSGHRRASRGAAAARHPRLRWACPTPAPAFPSMSKNGVPALPPPRARLAKRGGARYKSRIADGTWVHSCMFRNNRGWMAVPPRLAAPERPAHSSRLCPGSPLLSRPCGATLLPDRVQCPNAPI